MTFGCSIFVYVERCYQEKKIIFFLFFFQHALDDDDDDSPIIRGFADDEPLVVSWEI